MQNVILVIHLILAICLIAVVLLQRSEGGALGIGGGGGGLMSARGAATALSKVTWALAVGFLATSISLTIVSGPSPESQSVLDRLKIEGGGEIPLPILPESADDGAAPAPDSGALVPPPATEGAAAPADPAAPQTPPAAQ